MINQKQSKKRDKILDIFKSRGLLTAVEVAAILPEIDKATVYRNINRFVENGVLREIKLKKGISSFEINSDHHQHFVCTNCEKVKHIDIDENEVEKVLNLSGIKIQDLEMNIKGTCEDCT